mmetsp:Transcript_64804/g.187846  ORF Transcript_64804/g.187846 Transcript_64804/m.187846 type:complete len:556 (-) Transcript_64804:1920-3587(-)
MYKTVWMKLPQLDAAGSFRSTPGNGSNSPDSFGRTRPEVKTTSSSGIPSTRSRNCIAFFDRAWPVTLRDPPPTSTVASSSFTLTLVFWVPSTCCTWSSSLPFSRVFVRTRRSLPSSWRWRSVRSDLVVSVRSLALLLAVSLSKTSSSSASLFTVPNICLSADVNSRLAVTLPFSTRSRTASPPLGVYTSSLYWPCTRLLVPCPFLPPFALQSLVMYRMVREPLASCTSVSSQVNSLDAVACSDRLSSRSRVCSCATFCWLLKRFLKMLRKTPTEVRTVTVSSTTVQMRVALVMPNCAERAPFMPKTARILSNMRSREGNWRRFTETFRRPPTRLMKARTNPDIRLKRAALASGTMDAAIPQVCRWLRKELKAIPAKPNKHCKRDKSSSQRCLVSASMVVSASTRSCNNITPMPAAVKAKASNCEKNSSENTPAVPKLTNNTMTLRTAEMPVRIKPQNRVVRRCSSKNSRLARSWRACASSDNSAASKFKCKEGSNRKNQTSHPACHTPCKAARRLKRVRDTPCECRSPSMRKMSEPGTTSLLPQRVKRSTSALAL